MGSPFWCMLTTLWSFFKHQLKGGCCFHSRISLSTYLYNKGLNISPSKSQCIVFSKGRSALAFQHLRVDNRDIPVETCRFLGIFFDRRLTGKAHLKYLIDKGRKIVNIMSALSSVSWGAHPQFLLIIYRAVFRGAIEYGSHVFQFKGNKTVFWCLERLQWKAIRIALGYRTSTSVMLAEAREPPLRIRFNYGILRLDIWLKTFEA